MAENLTLEVQQRDILGKQVKQLREQGLIPAVIYGPQVEAPIHIQAPERALQSMLRQAGGTSLIDLHLGDAQHKVLVRDVQRDVIRGDLLHVDFYAVSLDTLTTVEVPINFVGVSAVIHSGEAMLITDVNAVEVECLPHNIPDELILDLSRLTEVGDTLTVADLAVPENVTVLADAADVLVRTDYAEALVTEEEEEGVEEVEAAFDAEEVAVIRRGKEEEEEAF